jgi:hypothetical protein
MFNVEVYRNPGWAFRFACESMSEAFRLAETLCAIGHVARVVDANGVTVL